MAQNGASAGFCRLSQRRAVRMLTAVLLPLVVAAERMRGRTVPRGIPKQEQRQLPSEQIGKSIVVFCLFIYLFFYY